MHSIKRGMSRSRYGVLKRYKKPPVEGQFDDVYSDHPNSEEPSELNHLDSDSPKDESKSSDDSEYEDVIGEVKYDEVEMNQTISDLT